MKWHNQLKTGYACKADQTKGGGACILRLASPLYGAGAGPFKNQKRAPCYAELHSLYQDPDPSWFQFVLTVLRRPQHGREGKLFFFFKGVGTKEDQLP